MIRVPRLKLNRHGVFCLRVLWLDESGKRRERLHSLNTKDPTVARLMALQFNTSFELKRAMTFKPTFPSLDGVLNKYDLDLSRGVMKSDGPDDHARMMEALRAYSEMRGTLPTLQPQTEAGRGEVTTQDQQRPLPRSIKFSEAVAAYLKEKIHDNAKRTLYEKGLLFDEFKGLLGDLEMNLYDKPTLVQWKNHEMNKKAGPSRVNKRLGYLNDFFNFCIGNGHSQHQVSPVEGLKISSRGKLKKNSESWKPFSDDDLKAIFSPAYLKAMPKPDHYWVPLIALFSGARLNEVAGLPVAHARIIDGVHVMELTDTKTSKSGRIVPIHQSLIALGLWDYIEHVRAKGEEMLFPYLVDGNNGYGKNAARKFALWLDDLGITDSRKVFHSTRATIITKLHSENANPAHAMQLTGHEGVQVQNIHFQIYTHGIGLEKLRDTLNLVSYPFSLDGLKVPLEKWTKFLAREKFITERKAKGVAAAAKRKGDLPPLILKKSTRAKVKNS